ncbi:Gfo/Idh/MocA family oxidoreductase [Polaromonas sp. YR568]|uniref:Gfo/Idh/MocA family protein n=1 Tax=Polaromonas sp. YR568 TaxID=1855301 RepID=UPI00313786D2
MNSNITDRKIRFALVGCGRISKNHFDSIAQHGDRAELVDICDIDPKALDAAVKATGARGHASLTTMLATTTADCVIVTTPSGLHPRQAIEIAQSGRHVLSEKPMATKWEDGVRMVRVCEEAGVYLFVVKQNRRNATLQLLKQAVEKKRFGQIYMVTLNVFWQRPQVGYYDQAKWRGTWEMDGGAFMNQASHYVDLLEWVVGPIESLHAYTATLARDIEAEDTGVLSVKWRSGALGSLNCTMLTYPKNLEGSVTILGEKGTVRIGGVAVNEIKEWQFADIDPDDEKIKEASYTTTSVYGFGHPLYYDNVIKVLRGEAEPDVDGREGLKTLEVLMATYRSARDGVRVGLPLEL